MKNEYNKSFNEALNAAVVEGHEITYNDDYYFHYDADTGQLYYRDGSGPIDLPLKEAMKVLWRVIKRPLTFNYFLSEGFISIPALNQFNDKEVQVTIQERQ